MHAIQQYLFMKQCEKLEWKILGQIVIGKQRHNGQNSRENQAAELTSQWWSLLSFLRPICNLRHLKLHMYTVFVFYQAHVQIIAPPPPF